MLDIIIIGAGVIGASVARELAKYKLNIMVIEKNNDVGDETSSANSAIIHSGYDPHPGTLKAKLNVLGNQMFTDVCKDLDVEFERIGSLTIATSVEEMDALDSLYKMGLENKAEVKLISKEELWEMEPYATKKALGALWAPTAGIINPFELVVALMENAMDNGVKLHLEECVTNIIKKDGYYEIITDKSTYQTKVVINAAGTYSDVINNMVNEEKETIEPRKGEYYVLEHFTNDFNSYVTHTLFAPPSSKGKGILISPTTHGNFLIGPSSEFVSDKEDKTTDKTTLDNVLKEAYRLVDDIPMKHLIREFSGVRAYHKSGDFVINMKEKGFINLLGIQSPGLASSPAIAKEAVSYVEKCLDLAVNSKFNPKRKPLYRINKLSEEERNQLIKTNPEFGQIICRCEKVSLGEIKDSINRNCGATTIKGVKKRVRPGFGKCQGGFCEPLVNRIIADELNIDQLDVKYSSKGSYILDHKMKEESNND